MVLDAFSPAVLVREGKMEKYCASGTATASYRQPTRLGATCFAAAARMAPAPHIRAPCAAIAGRVMNRQTHALSTGTATSFMRPPLELPPEDSKPFSSASTCGHPVSLTLILKMYQS